MARKFECPYTADRLREMYWKEGMSTADISAHCRSVIGKGSHTIVGKWLRHFNIPLRNKSEAMRLALKMQPLFRASVLEASKKGGESNADNRRGTPSVNPNWTKARKKGTRASVKQRLINGWEKRSCVCCGKEIHKCKSLFRYPPERTYCSRSCAAKGGWKRARKAKAEEALTRQIVAIVGYDPRENGTEN